MGVLLERVFTILTTPYYRNTMLVWAHRVHVLRRFPEKLLL